MVFRREGDKTTYEWSLHVYKQFPDQPAEIKAGARLGLDVAVVDKDLDEAHPVYMTWGEPSIRFRALDAGLLGELILVRE